MQSVTGRAMPTVILVTVLGLLSPAMATAADALFEQVIKQAQKRASLPYQPPTGQLPAELHDMDYDQYRNIRFRPERALWADDDGFRVQLFHTGFLFRAPVTIHVPDSDGGWQELDFDASRFLYEHAAAELEQAAAEGGGHAGFRLHYPVNHADVHDEVAVFLGASYFRLVGPRQVYGLSARGLAIDTAQPGGEEFPAFREFWLRPSESGDAFTVLALLDSPSVSGAYRFDVSVQADTEVLVDAHLFARKDVEKFGIAPLTSMFLHGQSTVGAVDDFRPQVHDSDGLLMHTSAGEWIWRPLSNRAQLRVSSLLDDARPGGFGLMQRERAFGHYLDLEARYHQRPGFWVAPLAGDWSDGGRVELVEIPTETETEDNIVAYWVPDTPFEAGQQRHYRYSLSTRNQAPDAHQQARVIRARSGWGAVPGQSDPPPRSVRRFIVDFQSVSPSTDQITADLKLNEGVAEELQVLQLPDDAGVRVSFLLTPEDDAPADMRLRLRSGGDVISETWSYVWYPDAR